MRAYIYDSKGHYVGHHDAQLDQMETATRGEEVYLCPAGGTFIEPPEAGEGELQVWTGESWELIEDKKEIPEGMKMAGGGLVPMSLIELAQANKITLAEFKNILKGQAEAALPVRRERGFQHNGSTWQGDEGAQLNMASLLQLVTLGAPGPFLWRDRDNVNHQMTPADLQGLAGPMAQFIQTCFQDTWEAKAAIDQAATAEDCQAILDALMAK